MAATSSLAIDRPAAAVRRRSPVRRARLVLDVALLAFAAGFVALTTLAGTGPRPADGATAAVAHSLP